MFFQNSGFCPICETDVTFSAEDPQFRDHYLCDRCRSIPRERALMAAIQTYCPGWKNLTIHESSPVNRGVSARMKRECKNYIPSQYFPDQPPGQNYEGVRCENLEALTFSDESIDLHVTQDVMEHLLRPDRAFAEIARTLRPGGMHFFTVPLVNKTRPSVFCAAMGEDGRILYLQPPKYHGNPNSPKRWLITVDWGYDICKYIFDSCGLFTHILVIDDLSRGIRANLIEVLVTLKPR